MPETQKFNLGTKKPASPEGDAGSKLLPLKNQRPNQTGFERRRIITTAKANRPIKAA